MFFDDDKPKSKIFPELSEDSRPRRQEPELHPSDWREEAFVSRPEPRFEIPHRAAKRDPARASTGPLWAAFTVLLLVLAGASFYGYRVLQDQNIQLNQVPAMLKSMATAGGRLDNLESQLSFWSQDLQNLSGRVDQMQQRVSANLRSTRRQATELTAQLRKQIQDQMQARDRVVDARLTELDTAQKTAQTRIAELGQQLSDAQQQIASLRQETNGDLALLHQHVSGNEQQMNNLSQQLQRERVNFEVSRNRISELSPEITMDVTSTDTRYQRFSGWVYYEPDRRYLWVRDQGALQPVVFYDQSKGRQYQVVVTSIREDSAAGYLLVPVATTGAQSLGTGSSVSGGQ